jgi:serine/threonine protein kinase
MADQLIGNYQVIKQIGAGGMAKVYLAVHKDIHNLKVILKILSDPRLVQRFKQEADKLALLDGHPNICRIKHFFTHGEDVVIAMEYIDGITLDDKLKSEGRLQIGESIRIIERVLDILEFAHQRGIYHRDIKPGNVMIDQSGTVKIIDFGIAKAKTDPDLTIAGTACGTPAYMAPEQFTPSDDTDYALVDIYATGTTLYRMLTGELPFKGDNEFALRDAKLFTDPPRPRSLAAGISKELEICLLRAIAKKPEDRFQSAGEMRASLCAAVTEQAFKKTDKTRDISVIRPRPSRKRRTVGIVSSLVVLAAAIGGWYLLWPKEPQPPSSVTLLTPSPGERFMDLAAPSLSWSESAGDNGRYIIEYAADSTFADSRTIAGVATGSYTFAAELENGRYFWRVYAVNGDGLRSGPSLWRDFVIDVTPAAAATGRIVIEVDPRGDIYLDGRQLGLRQNQAQTEVDTGGHTIRVENSTSRQKAYEESVRVEAGETVSRTFRFTFPALQPQARADGEVRIGSRPRGADIFIDGDLQEQKTPYTFHLAAGLHVFRGVLLVSGQELERIDTVRVVSDSVHRVMFEFE